MVSRARSSLVIKLDRVQASLALVAAVVLLFVVFFVGVRVGRNVQVAGEQRVSPQASGDAAGLGAFTDETVGEQGLTPPIEAGSQDLEMTFYKTLTGEDQSSLLPLESSRQGQRESPPDGRQARALDVEEGVLSAEKKAYTIQVGSFREKGRAEALSEDLREKGYPSTISSVTVPSGGTWYRVRSGRFFALEDAKAVASKMGEEEKLPVFITSETP